MVASHAPGSLCGALYKEKFGISPNVTPLASAGSDRRYFRLSAPDAPDVVGTEGPDSVENRCFISLALAFHKAGLHVPEILAVSGDGLSYLQSDLGDTALLPLLSGGRRMEFAAEALRNLVEMQTVDPELWENAVMAKPFSRRLVMWDLNYFKYEFLKPAGVVFDEEALEDDFGRLADELADVPGGMSGFMYRDFQSRNIMVCDDRLYFIDFQGGRRGPLVYDAVSFLWQAKAGFTQEERKTLMGIYASALAAKTAVSPAEVEKSASLFAFFRTLQVLGAYGFRGLVEKKAHFIESIPAALDNLRCLLDNGIADPYPELKRVARHCVESRFRRREQPDGLTVYVFSFSYKKGYPEDLSGNGGGFMFDCRGLHNPGRYEQYKRLTGLDTEVIDFLKEKGDADEFVENAVAIVSPTVARYHERGFTSLQVGFGCTGGRHRSVYCASNFAKRLAEKFPGVRIEVLHREQDIRCVYERKECL